MDNTTGRPNGTEICEARKKQGEKRSRVDETISSVDEQNAKSLKKSKFIYGNYDRYYGYRVRDSVAGHEIYRYPRDASHDCSKPRSAVIECMHVVIPRFLLTGCSQKTLNFAGYGVSFTLPQMRIPACTISRPNGLLGKTAWTLAVTRG